MYLHVCISSSYFLINTQVIRERGGNPFSSSTGGGGVAPDTGAQEGGVASDTGAQEGGVASDTGAQEEDMSLNQQEAIIKPNLGETLNEAT